MNRNSPTTIAAVVVLLSSNLHAQAGTSGFSRLEGPYLGQQPPSDRPELFAPGIISTGDHDGLRGFLNDGTVVIFSRASATDSNPIFKVYVSAQGDTGWTEPQETVMLDGPSDPEASLIPDETTVLVGSPRALDGNGLSPRGYNLWIVRFTDDGFVGPRMFPPPLNSAQNDIFPSMTEDGTIYFFSNRGGDFKNEDIFRSRLVAGEYRQVERLGLPVNTEHDEIDPFIAPDESYLIFCSASLPGFGDYDLYVTFRERDGSWSAPLNMGEGVNSHGKDWIPYVTPDGRFFFFNSDRSGSADVYWINAHWIESLRSR